jgi:hypothetical protein
MKGRPIVFNAEMVNAILEGRKTQTRRIVKYMPQFGKPEKWCQKVNNKYFKNIVGDYRKYSPHGSIGDLLWLRETFGFIDTTNESGEEPDIFYRADGEMGCKWRPSTYMPLWASRMTLEITGVRVERLQEITGEDAMREGVDYVPCYPYEDHYGRKLLTPCDYIRAVQKFEMLWDSIYAGKYPWESNPWVWVIEFKRV